MLQMQIAPHNPNGFMLSLMRIVRQVQPIHLPRDPKIAQHTREQLENNMSDLQICVHCDPMLQM